MIWSPVPWKTRMPPPTRTVPAGHAAVAGVWDPARFVTVCVTAATCTETPAASAGVACASHGIEAAITINAVARPNVAIPRLMQSPPGGLDGHAALVRESYRGAMLRS